MESECAKVCENVQGCAVAHVWRMAVMHGSVRSVIILIIIIAVIIIIIITVIIIITMIMIMIIILITVLSVPS